MVIVISLESATNKPRVLGNRVSLFYGGGWGIRTPETNSFRRQPSQ